MAHNIHQRLDGTWQALYVGARPWHGLGDIEQDAQTAAQIYERVFDSRVITTVPAAAWLNGEWVEQPGTRFTADEAAGTAFAPVGEDYPVIGDLEVLRLLQAVATEAGEDMAAIVAAFTLGNGARASATIDLTRLLGADALRVIRDRSPLEGFLVADWTHDATGALRIMDAINRVDCNNMLDAANASAANRGRLVRIAHKGSEATMAQQIHEAQRILGFATEEITASVKLLNDLADISLSRPDKWFTNLAETLTPIPEDAGPRTIGSRQRVRETLEALWQGSDTLIDVPKSPYRAIQVVAEYTDHYRGLRVGGKPGIDDPRAAAEKRFRSITDGPGADMKAWAMQLIREEFEIGTPVPVGAR